MTVRDPAGFSRSPFNPGSDLAALVAGRPVIYDVTLREGEQAGPVAFSLDDRVAIARALDRAGVPRIQMGYASRDDDSVAAAKAAGVGAELSELCVIFDAGWRASIDAAADAGVDALLLLMRASDAQLAMIDFTRERALARVREAVEYARRRVRRVVLQPSFATAADPAYLLALCRTAETAGAHEVAPCDSTGVANPEGVSRLVEALRGSVDLPVGVHLHDDYGLAVANSLAAIRVGASVVEVTVLGLGERAGNCPLEELVLALEGLYGVSTGIVLDQLTPLAHLVAERAGLQIPPTKAVVGGDVFTQKLDIHVRVTSRAPWLYEPFDPTLVGQRRLLKLGRGSGLYAVQAKLAELGLEVQESRLLDLVEFVNRQAVIQKGAVRDEQLISAVFGPAGPA